MSLGKCAAGKQGLHGPSRSRPLHFNQNREVNMPKFERIGIWIAVAGIAIFALVINSSLGGLQKAVEANATRLEQPTITASVLPGIPNALSEAWQQARAGAQDIAPEDSLWFTVRLANSGHDMAGEVSAELSLVPEIVKILAYGSGGKTLEASWSGPKIVEGGEQEKAVTVSFNALPEGESHLIFVAVRPDGFAEPPYATADREEWTALDRKSTRLHSSH